jgi:hypothetical protein
MSETLCPLACVRVGCQEADFLERNGAWLLTVIAGLSGCVGMVLTYFLKSRCRKISGCGMHCIRDTIDLTAESAEVTSSKA